MNKTIVLALMALTLPTVGQAWDFSDMGKDLPEGHESVGVAVDRRPFLGKIGEVQRVQKTPEPVVVVKHIHVHHHIVHE